VLTFPWRTWAAAIEAWPLGVMVRQSTWAFAFAEVVHLVGLTLVLGTVIDLNLRLFGAGLREQLPDRVWSDLCPWNRLGLALVVISGFILTVSEAVKLSGSPPFALKMVLFACAVAHSVVLQRRVAREPHLAGGWAKANAALAVLLWFGVAVAGRAIAFY
jgi:hypothetical protein